MELVAIEMDINHHQRHHHCHGYSKWKKKTNKKQKQKQKQKSDKYIIGYTHKNDEHVAPCWKTVSKNLTRKTAAVLCNVLLFVVL